jgi:hypothetical protein
MATAPTGLPVVVQKAYELSIWLIRKVENFPRSYRFSVGDRMVEGILDLLLRLVDAAYSRDKFRILSEVNGLLNRLRFLLRLAKDLNLLTVDSYGHAAERVEEIGRMVGGWRKASAGAAGCARWSAPSRRARRRGRTFEREFTRGLGTRPPGTPGACGSGYLRNSRW